jgi:hypothetical protein
MLTLFLGLGIMSLCGVYALTGFRRGSALVAPESMKCAASAPDPSPQRCCSAAALLLCRRDRPTDLAGIRLAQLTEETTSAFGLVLRATPAC